MESEKTILDNVAETAGQAGDAAMAAAEAVSEDALDVLNAAEAEADATADALWQNADAAAEMAAEAVDGRTFCLARRSKNKQVFPGKQSDGNHLDQFFPFSELGIHVCNHGEHFVPQAHAAAPPFPFR